MFDHLTPKQARAVLAQIRPYLVELVDVLGQMDDVQQGLDEGEIPINEQDGDEDGNFDSQREIPEISEIELQAIILAVMQEAGCLPFVEQSIVIHGILNRMLLPDEPFSGRWNIVTQLDSGAVVGGVLSGMPGETRAAQIEYAIGTFYAGEVYVERDSDGENLIPWFPNPAGNLVCATEAVDNFLSNPTEDFTGGAISWIHIDNEEMQIPERRDQARDIANRISSLGQDCIEGIIRCDGVDPIINGSEMIVGYEGVTVYINMNYNIPSTPNINCCDEGDG